MKGHIPNVINNFNGIWQRGDVENTPMDHLADADNLQGAGQQGVASRDGVDKFQGGAVPLADIKRVYNFPTALSNGLIVLTWDGTTGRVYHVVNSTTTHGPILSIAGMEDIAFLPYNGRGYISPFKTYPIDGLNYEKGLQNEFLYVYLGAGAAARKAAGTTPAGTLTIANGIAGHTDPGIHVFGVVGETDSGFLSEPCALNNFNTSAALSVSFSTVPTFTGAQWVRRHIVASKSIPTFNGDNEGYQLFFIPGATINDNVTTTLSNISFYDADLLDDASHLFDDFAEIAAGNSLCLYHNRLCLAGQFVNPSIVRVSAVGEPEAINEITGICEMPPDANPINNIQEMRDILYGFKRAKTGAWVDNGGVPTSWAYQGVDDSHGTSVHGIATVLDSGGTTADYLIIATYTGLLLFNGRYLAPELSYKIQKNWVDMERNEFRKIQVLHDPVTQRVYYVKTDRTLMVGEYKNGFDPKKIKWWPWSFIFFVNTIGIVNIDKFIIGADQV